MSAHKPTRSQFLVWFALGLIVVLAAILRFHHIALESFSFDESSSLYYATHPEFRALFWDNSSPLWAVFLKIWLWIFPLTELGARSLSVLFSLGAIIAMNRWSTMISTRVTGLITALLFATSAMCISFAHQVRMYALAQLATLLFLIALERAKERLDRKNRRELALATLLMVSAHFTTFPMLFFGVYELHRVGRITKRAAILTSSSIFFFAFLTLEFAVDTWALFWQKAVRMMFQDRLHVGHLLSSLGQVDPVIMFLVLALAILSLWSQRREIRDYARSTFGFILAILLLGSFFTWWDDRNIFEPRYFAFLVPQFLLLVALGLETLRDSLKKSSPWLAAAVVPAVLIAYSSFFYKSDWLSLGPPWRDAARAVAATHAKKVFTTRSKTLAVPYFNQAGINLEHFDYDTGFPMRLKEELQHQDRVWVVDDMFSDVMYFKYLEIQLKLEGLTFYHRRYENSAAYPVVALEILSPRASHPK